MSAMEKKQTQTNKKNGKRKSKIVGTKTKDKTQTGEKLHCSLKKL